MIEDSARLSREALDKIITTIPDSLDAIYEKILAQSTDVESARKLLHIVLAAAEPLTPQQLNIALCIKEHHRSSADLDKALEPDIAATIKGLCGLFVRVIDDRVYLVHQTAKEFLARPTDEAYVGQHWKHSLSLLDSNKVLAGSCIYCVLLYARLKNGIAKEYPEETGEDGEEDDDNSGRYWDTVPTKVCRDAFIYYACNRWHIHLRKTSVKHNEPLCQTALLLCDSGSIAYLVWRGLSKSRVGRYLEGETRYMGLPGFEQTSLTITATLGLASLMTLLLQQDPYRSIEHRRPALIAAASMDNLQVAKILIGAGGDCVHMTDKLMNTALHHAAKNGNEELAKLLIDNGD